MAGAFSAGVLGTALVSALVIAGLIGMVFVLDRKKPSERRQDQDLQRRFRTAWVGAQAHPLAGDIAEATALLSTTWLETDRATVVAGRRRLRLNSWGTKLAVALLARRGRVARSAYRILRAGKLSPRAPRSGAMDSATPAFLAAPGSRSNRRAARVEKLRFGPVVDDADGARALVADVVRGGGPVVLEFSGSAVTLSRLGVGAIIGLLSTRREQLTELDLLLNVDDMRAGYPGSQPGTEPAPTSADWKPALPPGDSFDPPGQGPLGVGF